MLHEAFQSPEQHARMLIEALQSPEHARMLIEAAFVNCYMPP
jgi:hypothetical protein